MIIVDERDIAREEPTPHGRIGMSLAYRITETVPRRTMEFRKRVLQKGAAIGLHVIDHDEVYYVADGTGNVTADGVSQPLSTGMTAYLYAGEDVGIEQTGEEPLTLIISYPLPERTD